MERSKIDKSQSWQDLLVSLPAKDSSTDWCSYSGMKSWASYQCMVSRRGIIILKRERKRAMIENLITNSIQNYNFSKKASKLIDR